MTNTQRVINGLNKFPEVVWDRFTGDAEDYFRCFGWIAREDDKFDFMVIDFDKGEVVDYSTSSAKYSLEFSKRINFTHENCQSMYEFFEDVVKTTKQNSEKSDKIISVPINYLFNKFERVGTMRIEKEWFDKVTPQHQFVVNGKFSNLGKFKIMEIALVKKP